MGAGSPGQAVQGASQEATCARRLQRRTDWPPGGGAKGLSPAWEAPASPPASGLKAASCDSLPGEDNRGFLMFSSSSPTPYQHTGPAGELSSVLQGRRAHSPSQGTLGLSGTPTQGRTVAPTLLGLLTRQPHLEHVARSSAHRSAQARACTPGPPLSPPPPGLRHQVPPLTLTPAQLLISMTWELGVPFH